MITGTIILFCTSSFLYVCHLCTSIFATPPTLWLWTAVVATALFLLLPAPTSVRAVREWSFNNWLAPRVGTFVMDDDSIRALKALRRRTRRASDPTAVIAIEPHGFACFHVALEWCGYAQQSGVRQQLGRPFMRRTRIVGHWIAQCVPLLRRLYASYGVIGNDRAAVERALESRHHIVLLPSGWDGKRHAVECEQGGADSVDVLARPVERVGFLALAARHNALLVPILVPDEPRAFQTRGPAFLHWLLRLPVPQSTSEMRVVVGWPIDTKQFDGRNRKDMDSLRQIYYDSLRSLGKRVGVEVCVL